MTDYDEWGVPRNKPWDDIKKGDIVEYVDTRLILNPVTEVKKLTKVTLKGIWDGEKVEFKDKDDVVVRTTRWLKKC